MAEKTFYIDHSILTHPQWWPSLQRAVSDGGCRLVLSVWNLFELGAGKDEAQKCARLAYLESLKPLWSVERLGVQKQEVERFLWAHKFRVTPNDLAVITPHFSVVNYRLGGPQTIIGETPKQFMRGTDFVTLNPLKINSPKAQTVWKAAARATLKSKEPEIFKGWIFGLIPLTAPTGKMLPLDERVSLAAWCYERRDQFLLECPSIAVEDAITADRAKDRMTKPNESDGPDMQHAVVGLAYCDIFFTADGNQARSIKVARRMHPNLQLAQLCTTPEEFERGTNKRD